MTRILIVEDEPAIAAGLAELLATREYATATETSGDRALARALAERFDLLLLDVMLPNLSGFDVLRKLRKSGNRTPVILLTARGAESDRVLGFELEADDYVAKPFSPLELLGRVQAVLRRTSPPGADPAPAPAADDGPAELRLGAVHVDFRAYTVHRGGVPQEAPARALDVLRALARSPGAVVTRDRLIDLVWGPEEFINQRTLNNLVLRLRQLVEPEPAAPRYLKTVHGVGYRFDPPA